MERCKHCSVPGWGLSIGSRRDWLYFNGFLTAMTGTCLIGSVLLFWCMFRSPWARVSHGTIKVDSNL